MMLEDASTTLMVGSDFSCRETSSRHRDTLRIGIISNSLPLPGRSAGGVAQFASDLARGLALRGHDVTAWCYEGSGEDSLYTIRRLPASSFATSRVGRVLTEGYLGNLFTALPRFNGIDALIAMGDSLLLPLHRLPVVRVVQGTALQEALSSRRPIRILTQLGIYPLELIAAAMQPGSVAGSRNTTRFNPFVRRVISNGIDLSAFHPDPAARSAEPSLLFVGTLKGRKRGGLLLEWFRKEIRPAIPETTLTIVGPSGEPEEGVVYRTGVPREELAALYRRAWVYASPSVYEGFGLPYLEAMASGTPVVATPNPGSKEVLAEGEYGLLASDETFSTELLGLLSSPRKREELSVLGLKRAAEYSLDRMIDQYEQLLRDLISSRASA
jgi:phosphatidyl-myo-inositol alpha-mannosyltransferase